MDYFFELFLLFTSSLIAATLFPAGSELVLTGLHLQGKFNVWLLIFIATFGNVLGSCINYFLGRFLIKFKNRKWFPVRGSAITKSTKLFQKRGVFVLLFAWLPIIGDPLTLIAGIFRVSIPLFLILVTIGKLARYVALVLIF